MSALTAVEWTLPAAPELIADMRSRVRAARLPASAVAGRMNTIGKPIVLDLGRVM